MPPREPGPPRASVSPRGGGRGPRAAQPAGRFVWPPRQWPGRVGLRRPPASPSERRAGDSGEGTPRPPLPRRPRAAPWKPGRGQLASLRGARSALALRRARTRGGGGGGEIGRANV